MNDIDLLLQHFYHLAMVHEDQYVQEVNTDRKAYLLGVARGLLLGAGVIEAAFDIQVKFKDPYPEPIEEDLGEM